MHATGAYTANSLPNNPSASNEASQTFRNSDREPMVHATPEDSSGPEVETRSAESSNFDLGPPATEITPEYSLDSTPRPTPAASPERTPAIQPESTSSVRGAVQAESSASVQG